MAGKNQGPNMDQFELYFRRADLDQDGRISGPEAVSFFQGSGLPKQVLAQIWTHADQNRTGYLGRPEFYNALKLVTVAQSKRGLTPDIVKAALYGPASAKIPAPQINLGAIPTPQSNLNVGPPALQTSSSAPAASQSMGIRGPQGFSSQQNQVMRPPRPPLPNPGFQPQQGGVSQGMPRGGTMVASRPPSSNFYNDWLGGGTGGPPPRVTSQVPTGGINPSTSQEGFGFATPGLTPSAQPRPQATASLPQHVAPKPNDPTFVANQAGAKDSNNITVSGNGFVSNSMFGDAFSATSSQEKNILPVSSANTPASAGTQSAIKSSQFESFQGGLTQQPTGSKNQQGQSTTKQNQQVPVQTPSTFPARAENSAAAPSQLAWPKMTQSVIQKYSKVFMEVDTDKDGKITGEQARNLFLSWRLPREVLKQVWDLSDQDNDSMLSLREFCIALYLMERYREGRPLPRVLPTSVIFEETPLPASGQAIAGYSAPAWRPTHGVQQPQGMPGSRSVTPTDAVRPPRPVPIPQVDGDMQPRQQKAKVPVLEKHLIDQLSTEEQNSLNSKFQEATEADKKVSELEKEILDCKEKIEFYRSKMQELILYKSRCDNRLNEITERVSADKREVESLAKKYEEKYKQSGDVASKLTIEEATFRDIQEKKMELYRAIVKLEKDGNADNMQAHVDHIQVDLEEQVKALNERCKMYGLRAKPTSLVELPFGWQPGIQEGAADWDEQWDKFEDEGFTFVKELTLDVQNVIVSPKPKSLPAIQNKSTIADEDVTAVSSSNANGKSEDLPGAGDRTLEEVLPNVQSGETFTKTPPDSPASRNAVESPSKKFDDSPVGKNAVEDSSPHAIETQSEHGGAESALSGDKRFDEPGWGRFDIPYDTDATWDLNPIKTKDTDNERNNENSFMNFDSGEWGLNPIRTEVPKKGPFFDSIPGTPAFSYTGSPPGGDLFEKRMPFGFADSVPSTPAYSYAGSPRGDNTFQKKSTFDFADSIPSTPAYGYSDSPQKKSSFAFADSVPSTPMFSSSNSPRRFSDGPEDHSFNNNFSRFDSFNSTNGGLFPPRDPFSRFDSFHSTTQDSEYDQGFYNPPREGSFARFDSMRSTADSDFGHSLFQPHDSSFPRFDSMRSTRDSTDYNQGFPSFDDTDPFGSSDPFRSNDPFKTSLESQTPRRDSDSWRAF